MGDVLKQIGDEAFLAAEAEVLEQWCDAHESTDEFCVLSLTGSNGLDGKGMQRLARNGWALVYLDARTRDIEARCQRMKVDRIVGQAAHGLRAVLDRRADIYQQHYHVRMDVADGDTPTLQAERILQAVAAIRSGFVSTRGSQGHLFEEVLREGLANDGGLYCPAMLPPPIRLHELERWLPLSFQQVMLRVLEKFPLASTGEMTARLAEQIDAAYRSFARPDDVLPLRHYNENIFLMEAFHGPTASFKDLSLQLLPRLLSTYRPSSNGNATETKVGLLVATSGDTGTAALDGFGRDIGTPTVVLYPHAGVSSVQEAQMRSAPANALVIAVDGLDFDGCQAFIKQALAEPSILCSPPSLVLSSANSMNWGRLAPQVAYAVAGYLHLVRNGGVRALGDPVDVCYPTGNFGNVLGAVFARQLGLPIRRIVCASNENSVLTDFLRTNDYDLRRRTFVKTNAPAMDILIASNLERLLYYTAREHCSHVDAAAVIRDCYDRLATDRVFRFPEQLSLHSRLFEGLTGDWCSQSDCLATIKRAYRTTGQILDPHTAIGVRVAERLADKDVPVLVCATAHFAKFPETVLPCLGQPLSSKSHLSTLLAQLDGVAGTSPHNQLPLSIRGLLTKPVNHTRVLSPHQLPSEISKYLQSFA